MTICYHVSAVIYNRCSYAGCTDTGFFTRNDLFDGSWIIGVFLLEIIPLDKVETCHRPKEQIMGKLEKKVGFHLSLQP